MATDLEKRIRDIFAAISAHDLEKYLSFCTDDIFVEELATGITSRGKEEYRANLNRTLAAIPDLKGEVTSYFASGNHECVEYVMSGTPRGEGLGGIPATGKSFTVRCVAVA